MRIKETEEGGMHPVFVKFCERLERPAIMSKVEHFEIERPEFARLGSVDEESDDGTLLYAGLALKSEAYKPEPLKSPKISVKEPSSSKKSEKD